MSVGDQSLHCRIMRSPLHMRGNSPWSETCPSQSISAKDATKMAL